MALAGETKVLGASEAPQQLNLEAVVMEFRERLGISENIALAIVEGNKYLVSVQRSKEQKDAFIIQFERHFLSTLTEEDMRAVLAHEMGHIWIFTHHPYLQTEALANQKASELVPRESLRQIYEKVWRIEGQKGTLEEFLARVE